MSDIAYKIKVMQHFENGGKVESVNRLNGGTWKQNNDPAWNWDFNQYRIKEEPKTIKVDWWLSNDGSIQLVEAGTKEYMHERTAHLKLIKTEEIEL